MGLCEYGRGKTYITYNIDHDKQTIIEYKCPRNSLLNKNHCEFHDNEYAQNNPDDVMKLFYGLVDDAIKNAKPLLCFGFYFPGKVDLTEKEFKNNVSVDFSYATFTESVNFSYATFTKTVNFSFATFTKEAYFLGSDFTGEVTFDKSNFPSPKSEREDKKIIPIIKFDYCTFRKRVQFIGESEEEKPLHLGLVSFKGVDLSNVEFHNVKWQEIKELIFITRNAIVDEKMLGENGNYEEVSKIYNQLRKNYESKLLFNEASNFFVGEMEAIRRSLWIGIRERKKIASIPYFLYKVLALYGESYFLPMVIWTPALIGLFIAWRFITGECSLQSVSNVISSPPTTHICTPKDFFIDSFAAYFQFPRSTINPIDTIERIVSIPILGTAFIAIRRKFERTK